ncbi:tRNA pseudouridine(38-40) synthase TruA [Conexibacter sp. W3-3-2]|uniref:tRNA pseudouridine(38-40) synthase TruA n=1 Tax=Conexibacter sp. W3-3-2 TaxID=2675227 RepID=UPI0012B75DC5|nr:tRNA pseudouridine(38-40) synthase TruA [Conexibacter sp. W3-3-2]MTD44290.1 tRNA pseudouridine(38-40) synthase TruA [Conexibacter sp. W3-3-2]
MATSRLVIEYDGTAFHGWARQPGQRTVQGELERVLAVVARREVPLTVAGRTDTGVHARGQVASHDGPPLPLRNLNALLPDDVAVTASLPCREGFDARRDALWRSYRYEICTRHVRPVFGRTTALHLRSAPDLDVLQDCAALLPGTHDFTAFTPTETEHVHFSRTIHEASWTATADGMTFTIRADAFMRHMNRALVGTMLDVAAGRLTRSAFAALLAGAPRSHAGMTAPPHGLTFTGVGYPPEVLRPD